MPHHVSHRFAGLAAACARWTTALGATSRRRALVAGILLSGLLMISTGLFALGRPPRLAPRHAHVALAPDAGTGRGRATGARADDRGANAALAGP